MIGQILANFFGCVVDSSIKVGWLVVFGKFSSRRRKCIRDKSALLLELMVTGEVREDC